MKKEIFNEIFLREINSFMEKVQDYEAERDSLSCNNCFKNNDSYKKEKIFLSNISNGKYKTTKEQGDVLEDLVKSLFERITFIHNVNVTNKDIAIGQTDIQLFPIDEDDMLYEIWGIVKNKPKSIIGECKNYPKDNVDRPEIEKICWRTCKGGCLSFFIGFEYSKPAIDEIAYFNNNKDDICHRCEGAIIVPLTVYMLEAIIENDINFCYFVRWAIYASKMMSIANYIHKID